MEFATIKEFQRAVRPFVDQHLCARRDDNKSANRAWVIEELEEKLRDQPEITTAEAEMWFKKEFRVN
ncbi:hypothetical protein PIB30_073610 [Stylosanthes scabra]|uniref:Uncharacterized protein n=1 Tax=Stylosanthes scabra TaxID=79078 RepID=A0ABU6QPZ8_9FABA|nr:hypothetical protein [Stylosanthes scabra]